MSLVFKIGEHSDFAPVPPNFPRCGSYQPYPFEVLANISTTAKNRHDDEEENNEVNYHKDHPWSNWLPSIINDMRASASISNSASNLNHWKLTANITLFIYIVLIFSF